MKTLLALLLPLSLAALPVDNPCAPALFHTKMVWDCPPPFCASEFTVRAGFSGDYIFNRRLQIDRADNDADVRQVELYTNAGSLTINLWKKFDLFGLFGATKGEVTGTSSAFSARNPVGIGIVPNEALLFNLASEWSWGAGVRAALFSLCDFCFGLEGAYFTTCPAIASITSFASGFTTVNPSATFKYHEWLIALGTTYCLSLDETWQVLPYFSAEWNPARVAMDNIPLTIGNPATQSYTITLNDLDQQKSWGYALGLTLLANEGFSLNFEGRFVNLRAFSFNTQLLF